MNREIGSLLGVILAIPPEAYAADEASVIIDTQGADSLTLIAQFGATVDAGATLLFEASDDDAMAGAVTLTPTSDGPAVGEYLYGPDLPVGSTDEAFKWSYVGPYRYVQVTLDTDGAADFALLALKSELSDQPAD